VCTRSCLQASKKNLCVRIMQFLLTLNVKREFHSKQHQYTDRTTWVRTESTNVSVNTQIDTWADVDGEKGVIMVIEKILPSCHIDGRSLHDPDTIRILRQAYQYCKLPKDCMTSRRLTQTENETGKTTPRKALGICWTRAFPGVQGIPWVGGLASAYTSLR
jgi:hypothetical protein